MRKFRGIVTSDKMDKTRVVAVSHLVKHERYGKYVKRTMRVKAHDAENAYRTGDHVVIQETRPRSKDKRWEIVGRDS